MWRTLGVMATIEDAEGLVELPKFDRAPEYQRQTSAAQVKRRRGLTLTDRLVASAGSDRVVVDVSALEQSLDELRCS